MSVYDRLDVNTPRSSSSVMNGGGTGSGELAVEMAAQEAADARMELKRLEQRERQLRRQIEQSDGEKRTLREKVAAAESALRTAVRDRDALMTYIANVLEQCKQVPVKRRTDELF